MKKLSVFLLSISMLLSSVCGLTPSSAYAASDIDSDCDSCISEKTIYHTSAETLSQGTVRMSGVKDDEITVFFKVRRADKVQGLLSELNYNKSYLNYNGYDQYYTDTFVNFVNDSFMMFSVMLFCTGKGNNIFRTYKFDPLKMISRTDPMILLDRVP